MEDKMNRYTTAFCPFHNQYVKITKVRQDDVGALLIDTLMNGHKMVFRSYELTEYCI